MLWEGEPYPVEVNPRYSASVEVLELTLGQSFLQQYGRIFETDAAAASARSAALRAAAKRKPMTGVLGKGIHFARGDVVFPADGPWMATLGRSFDPWAVPDLADIPAAGQTIVAGRPVLTFFARGTSVDDCHENLRCLQRGLDRWLIRS